MDATGHNKHMKDIDKVLEKWIYPVITFKDYFMTHEDRVKRMIEIDEWLENNISNDGLIK